MKIQKRSEYNLIKKIKKEYGKDVSIFIGGLRNSNYQIKHFVSTSRI